MRSKQVIKVMRDVNRGRKGSLGLGGPRDKPNYPIGEYNKNNLIYNLY
jgi:hypothetical protein